MLDIVQMKGVLDGVVMELQDCALPLLKGNASAPPMSKIGKFVLFNDASRAH